MKGRPITPDEFDDMLACLPEVVGPSVESWSFLLRGYWWGGLRLAEALALRWDTSGTFGVVDLDDPDSLPTFGVRAEGEKGNRDRVLPMAPEFAQLLRAVPVADRVGWVFAPGGPRGGSRRPDNVGATIARLGQVAGIVVNESTGKTASAQDLRRSFGERWASRVMPQVLMELMRHESIATTLRYYVGRNAQTAARAAWDSISQDP